MGNNGNKLRRKKVPVCLVGGYRSAIMVKIKLLQIKYYFKLKI